MTSAEILSRRHFLRRAAGFGAGLGAFHTLFDLRLINNALASVNVDDYKALICVFLAGGNDGFNTLVPAPADARYAGYKSIRGPGLALWEDQAAAIAATTGTTNVNQFWAAPISNASTGSHSYAVHSNMSVGLTSGTAHPSVKSLFDSGKLAFVANTGVLVEPLTRAQFQGKTRQRPPQLFSHNDQVNQWQTSVPDQISRTGWGGRTIDKLREELARQGIPSGSISLSVSLAGSNTWEVGDVVNQFQVNSSSGAVSFTGYLPLASRAGGNPLSVARSVLIDKILRDPASGGDSQLAAERLNLALNDYRDVNERSINNGAALSAAMTRLTAGNPDAAAGAAIDASFGIGVGGLTFSNMRDLERQLHTVARIISQRSFLSMRRQIFFCQIGGFDNHNDPPTTHAGLLNTLSRALGKFYAATQALGVDNKVTTFTASDFGRTFKSNSIGTDHAWGSNAIVLGGAVQGGRIFGTYPTLQLGGPDDTDGGSSPTGRFIPTTSTDEYAATLARWFGLGESELDVVFPNLNRFASRNLGFLA
ncbi:MAG: DUF1501 domain-containing protein [Verrucomicrobiales bacterium]|nr:DUF1501 domain-containing protein [Verrucomicrobiales bacterium]